jgi:NADH-quinone oxidoreductase subunit D
MVEEKTSKRKILEALNSQDVSAYFQDPLENEMIINMGPQHPATHGVLRLLIKLDGETIVAAVPEVGYLHRGYEKLAENMSYHEYIPHTDRLDYLSPLSNNVAYVLAVEKLAGIDVPRRAQFIRVIIAEMARIMSHLVAMGSTAMDVGALTVLLWGFREREKLQDIQDVFAGVRFTTSFTRIGGLANDMSDEAINMLISFLEQFSEKLLEVENLLLKNRIFIQRCEGVGVLTKTDAVAMGITGPNLRASGIVHDLRIDEPYLVYPEMDFDIPIYNEGDALARFCIRLDEMKESVKIIRQAIAKMPQGSVNAALPKKVLPQKEKIYGKMEELIHDFMLINFGIHPPVGEVYHAIENSKGELGFYISSLGNGAPWRLKIHSPSFINIQSLPILLNRHLVSDVVAIIGSIDPVMGEADK